MTVGLRGLYGTIVHPPASYELLFETTNPALDTSPFPKTDESVNSGVTRNTTVFRNGTSSGEFNGSSIITIPSRRGDDFCFNDSDFTVEAWVRATSLASNSHNVVLSKHQVSSGGYSWMLTFADGGFLRWAKNGTYNLIDTISLSLNTWTHIAIVRSNRVLYFYKDGFQSATLTDSGAYANLPTTVFVGQNGDAGGVWRWVGQIDDLRVYRGYAKYTNNFIPT